MPKPTTNPLQRMVSKFRDVLAETERLPPDKLRAYQENLLAPLLLHARHNVPFYRDRLASLCSQTDVDLARWRTIPILTREDLQRNLKALSASSVPAHLGSTSHGETSGSSGRPIRYLVNELANVASLGTTDRIFRWWGFNGEKAMANFVARHGEDARPPDGKTESGWRIGHAGMHHMLDLSADTGTQLEWLCKRRPNYLTAHSFVLNEVAKLALQRKQHIKLERIISIGTVLTDDIRKVCKMAFGVEPIDQYGAQETGLLACECPWCGRLHVNAETVLVEILDSDGKPCPPGEAGRVIVTSFYNYAMPLIRYEIGDFAAAAHEQPKCSTRLPALEKIMGR